MSPHPLILPVAATPAGAELGMDAVILGLVSGLAALVALAALGCCLRRRAGRRPAEPPMAARPPAPEPDPRVAAAIAVALALETGGTAALSEYRVDGAADGAGPSAWRTVQRPGTGRLGAGTGRWERGQGGERE